MAIPTANDIGSRESSSVRTDGDSSSSSTKPESLIQYSLTSEDYIDQFIPFIRSELQNKNSLDDLIANLEKTSQEKQDVLEGLSFDSVDDLTSSVDKIKSIVQTSAELSKELSAINEQLNKTGTAFAEEKKKALHYKKLYNKINETFLTINSCLDMLERTNKILELIQSKQFYKALINLQSLARMDFEEIEQFEFSVRIYNSIPTFKQMIIEETFNQLIKWMNVSLEKNFPIIGEIMFDNYKSLNDAWLRKQASDEELLKFKVNSPIERTLREEKFKYFDPLENDQIQIDMGPLYHSILVFESVNELDKLKEDFANEILRRRDRLIYPIREAMTNNNFDMLSNNESLKILMYSMSAFFIADRYISEKTQFKVRTRKQTDDLFDSIISKFVPLLEKYIMRSTDTVKKATELVDIIGCFVQIAENWRFDSRKLYDLMVSLFKLYIKLSAEEFRKEYMSLSVDDDSQPITVDNLQQLKNVRDNCFYKFEDKDMTFPKVLPYSVIYPGSCLRLRSFIHGLYSFLEKYYDKRLDTLSQMISVAVDQVLINIILKDLDNKVHSSYKEEVSQNLINLEFFSNSVYEIEKYLNFSSEPLILKSRTASTMIKLKAENAFKSTRRRAENGMFEMVDSKVDMLFDMVDFDWSARDVNDEPSISIKDMGLYLENMFKLDFSHLPYSIKSLLLIRSFDKITTHMKRSIAEADSITGEGVQNFEIDLNYMESLIPSLKIGTGKAGVLSSDADKANKTLQTMFVSLKQIVSLLKDGDLENYKDETIRQTKYSSIKPEEAQQFVNKLEEYRSRALEGSGQFSRSSIGGSPSPAPDTDDERTRSLFPGLKRQATTASFNGFSFKK
ncbi:DEKNAAC105489 [Brettanomyces naardenensis]|uniref:Exocyst complex component SEC15 n=1 Tax=Brettanomyces naardenensis TaxID=13370 RepID=A0A448YTT7_BRENA|nr:DEKNAAC105489 [Brettanomyces naardenensis]